MNENQQYHRCKHDNVIVWKDTTKEGQPADLHKHVPTPYEKLIQDGKEVWEVKPALFVVIAFLLGCGLSISWVWMCSVIISGL